MDVRSERVATVGRSPFWRFAIKTSSPIDWRLELARDESGCRLKARMNDSRTIFKRGSGKAVLRLVSDKWPYDYQAGARRSCHLESRSYPVYDTTALTTDIVKRLKPLEALEKGLLSVTAAPDAAKSALGEVERVKEWFRFYSHATMKRYREPASAESKEKGAVNILLRADGEKLKPWQSGRCFAGSDGALEIVARSPAELHKNVLAFLSRLDVLYPYYGKLPDGKILKEMGLAGKTLRKGKTKTVFHPTLLEMLRKTGLKPDLK